MSTWWVTDLPNWLVAIGTLGAFGTGGAVLLRELNRDREREAIAERRQASTVAAWPTRRESTVESLSTITALLILNNSSTEPVYQIRIEYLVTGTKQSMSDELQILPPGRYERELPDGLQETWIETAEGWIKQGASVSSPTPTPYSQPWNFTYEISFIDASSRHWRRQADGSLKRQQPIVGQVNP